MNTDAVLVIDPVTDSLDTTSMHVSGGKRKWAGGVLANDGLIYGIPAKERSVIIIDPLRDIVDTSTISNLLKDEWKWFGGALGSNGLMYGMPAHVDAVLVIHPIQNRPRWKCCPSQC